MEKGMKKMAMGNRMRSFWMKFWGAMGVEGRSKLDEVLGGDGKNWSRKGHASRGAVKVTPGNIDATRVGVVAEGDVVNVLYNV